MNKLVIDGPGLRAIATRPGLAREFPFLRRYAAPPVPSCCGKAARLPDPNPGLAAISRLPPDRLKVMKELLGVSTIVVWVTRAARVTKLEL